MLEMHRRIDLTGQTVEQEEAQLIPQSRTMLRAVENFAKLLYCVWLVQWC